MGGQVVAKFGPRAKIELPFAEGDRLRRVALAQRLQVAQELVGKADAMRALEVREALGVQPRLNCLRDHVVHRIGALPAQVEVAKAAALAEHEAALRPRVRRELDRADVVRLEEEGAPACRRRPLALHHEARLHRRGGSLADAVKQVEVNFAAVLGAVRQQYLAVLPNRAEPERGDERRDWSRARRHRRPARRQVVLPLPPAQPPCEHRGFRCARDLGRRRGDGLGAPSAHRNFDGPDRR